MDGQFFQRLRAYYMEVAAVLRGEAKAALIFPNTTDIGMSRERVYAEFLRQHAPSKCNVFFGGFLFGEDGSESVQLDVLVTTDTTPQFNFHNKDGKGKSFSPVEGTLAVVSIKSTLNKNELEDALAGIASIPHTKPVENRTSFGISIPNYDDWPHKIIYATDGISVESLLGHLNNYYLSNPDIPIGRRPNVIHVSGKYIILRATSGMNIWNTIEQKKKEFKLGTFRHFTTNPDLQGILWVLEQLQEHVTASTHILYSYTGINNQVRGLPSHIDIQPDNPPDSRSSDR